MTQGFDAELRDRAVAAAQGRAPFDLLITGAKIADMVTGEIRAADIGIIGAMIASVHLPGTRDDAAEHLKADGMIATPGLIDSHMHVESSMVTPETYAAAVLPRGVTTVVWDPHEFGNVAGVSGVDYALESAARNTLRILPLAPSCVPSAPGYETTGADFDASVIDPLMQRDGIVGLAEVMDMNAVTSRAPRMRAILEAAIGSGKLICGHARSLTGGALQAYASAGITSDHEVTSADDLLEKLRAGLTIELRGSHPYLLEDFAKLLQSLPQMPPTVTFCSDDVFPDDLLSTGAVDNMLRLMVGHGLDPMRALQAATLNAAIRLNRHDVGHIAPGKRADIVLFDDLDSLTAQHVFCNGAVVQQVGASQFPESFLKTCDLDALAPADFEISAKGPKAKLATIAKPRFTEWGQVTLDVADGAVRIPPDITRIAVINRYGAADAKPKIGLLQEWGTWDGAFATTVSHDSHNLTVFGGSARDMAVAANAVARTGGGMACVQGEKVIALLPLPVAGLVSDKPLDQVAQAFAAVRDAMAQVVAWNPPYLTFKALVGATLACNAGPHQTDLGIADPLAGKLLSSPILAEGLDA